MQCWLGEGYMDQVQIITRARELTRMARRLQCQVAMPAPLIASAATLRATLAIIRVHLEALEAHTRDDPE